MAIDPTPNPPTRAGATLPQAGGAAPLFSNPSAPGVAPNAGGSNILQLLAAMQALQAGGGGGAGALGGRPGLTGKPGAAPPAAGRGLAPAPTGAMAPPPTMAPAPLPPPGY